MKLLDTNITQEFNEDYLIETLNLNNKTILELGCGNAQKTITLANTGFERKVTACEVDEIQHQKNLQLNYDNIEFKLCGAQDIEAEDESIDVVFLFKSFHHIPVDLMPKALSEIKRVLKPNGLVYISEPLHLGEQNALVAMFHNEEEVRKIAFEHIKKSVENEEFKLFKEIFFQTPVSYKNFEDFKTKQMDVTHLDKVYSQELIQKVKDAYEKHSTGEVTFLKPFRVDILQKV